MYVESSQSRIIKYFSANNAKPRVNPASFMSEPFSLHGRLDPS